MPSPKTPAHGLHGEDKRQSALRDTRGGTYDPPTGSAPPDVNERRTSRPGNQPGATLRPDARPRRAEPPEGLRHRRGPLNRSSGRRAPERGNQ